MYLFHKRKNTKTYPLFKEDENSNFLFLSKNLISKINTYQNLNLKEKQYIYEGLKYNGIEQNELSSNKFHFFYHKKLGQVSYSQYKPPKFLGTEPIAPVHGNDNSYLILMIQMKTSGGQAIPLIHNTTKSERWLCYTYESKLDKGKTIAELKLKDSGIYTKDDFWKKTI